MPRNRRKLVLRQLAPRAALELRVERLLSTAELADVLADGHLSGAVLDVCDTEPLPPSSPLWGMENVLLTPHVSGRGFGHDRGTERLIWEIVMDNLARC